MRPSIAACDVAGETGAADDCDEREMTKNVQIARSPFRAATAKPEIVDDKELGT